MKNSYKYHYAPKFGWVNDPNGLVFYGGYYHLFYQHSPKSEKCVDPIFWGHARTKDFLKWEELPLALSPDAPYDEGGCWSGTAIEKDGKLYLFYASILKDGMQQISVAYSTDGIRFEKYACNPVLKKAPMDGVIDFRDPAVIKRGEWYHLIIASGNRETKRAFLLNYRSKDLFNWEYVGIIREWQDRIFCECPSILHYKDKYMIATSVCHEGFSEHEFSVSVGQFDGKEFIVETEGFPQCGPDQYAGQMFTDGQGRNILITWIPGWKNVTFNERGGTFSLPMQVTEKDGKIYTYPVEEVRHLLKDEDERIEHTEKGFVIKRTDYPDVVFEGKTDEMKVLKDGEIIEIFIKGGEKTVTAIID